MIDPTSLAALCLFIALVAALFPGFSPGSRFVPTPIVPPLQPVLKMPRMKVRQYRAPKNGEL